MRSSEDRTVELMSQLNSKRPLELPRYRSHPRKAKNVRVRGFLVDRVDRVTTARLIAGVIACPVRIPPQTESGIHRINRPESPAGPGSRPCHAIEGQICLVKGTGLCYIASANWDIRNEQPHRIRIGRTNHSSEQGLSDKCLKN